MKSSIPQVPIFKQDEVAFKGDRRFGRHIAEAKLFMLEPEDQGGVIWFEPKGANELLISWQSLTEWRFIDLVCARKPEDRTLVTID